MVQLKSTNISLNQLVFVGFNSCMVQLKLRGYDSAILRTLGFNSCMVQLKYEKHLFYIIIPKLF